MLKVASVFAFVGFKGEKRLSIPFTNIRIRRKVTESFMRNAFPKIGLLCDLSTIQEKKRK